MSDLQNPLLFRTIRKMEGRFLIDIHQKSFIDFSTQCYLGFDQNQEIAAAQIQGIQEYGNVTPWSRTVASYEIYEKVEAALAELTGFESANLFPSTTLLNHGVIPALAGFKGALIALKSDSYLSSYEGAFLAKAKGASLEIWQDESELELILNKPFQTKLVIIDGVNSMSGGFANLPDLQQLCLHYHAKLFVDDAHGFGVLGGNPNPDFPLGKLGNGLHRYFNLPHDNLFYVGCLSKAYGLPGAFIACSAKERQFLMEHATPHDISFAGQASSMLGILKAIEVNQIDGDNLRSKLTNYKLYLEDALKNLGLKLYSKPNPFPIITLQFDDDHKFLDACHHFSNQGILPTAEPHHKQKDEYVNLLRFTITAAHTELHIEQLLHACKSLADLK